MECSDLALFCLHMPFPSEWFGSCPQRIKMKHVIYKVSVLQAF